MTSPGFSVFSAPQSESKTLIPNQTNERETQIILIPPKKTVTEK
jgi:hypothetical protein